MFNSEKFNSKQTICKKAIELMAENRFEDAVKLYSSAIESNGDDWRLFVNRSFCLQRINALEASLEDAETAININSEHISGRYRKACVLLAKKEFRSADKWFDMALECDPNDRNSRVKRKECHRLFLKELGYNDIEAELLVHRYKSCSDISDAVISGDLNRLLESLDANSELMAESMISAESSCVFETDPELLSSSDIYMSDDQSLASDDFCSNDSFVSKSGSYSRGRGIIASTPDSNYNSQGLRIPKSIPFVKRIAEQTNKSDLKSDEQTINKSMSEQSFEKQTSNESTPNLRPRLIKTTPKIRRLVVTTD